MNFDTTILSLNNRYEATSAQNKILLFLVKTFIAVIMEFHAVADSGSICNVQALDNPTTPTKNNQNLLPSKDSQKNLGSSKARCFT